MRQSSLPDMNAKLTPAEAGQLKRQFMVQLLNRKGEWLETHLRKLLPRHIYNMAWDTTGTEDEFMQRQEKVKKWMREHDIRLEEHGLNARLFRGREKISSFFVKLAEK